MPDLTITSYFQEKKVDPLRYPVSQIEKDTDFLQIKVIKYQAPGFEGSQFEQPTSSNALAGIDNNNLYLENNSLNVQILGSGYTWLDTGTPDSLLEASNFIQTIEKRQGKKVACIEEIAYSKGYINSEELKTLAQNLYASEYGQYLLNLLDK